MAQEANTDIGQWRGPSPASSPSELADRYAVSQLVKIYALGIDMRDYDLCRSAFAPDAVAENRGGMAPIDDFLPKLYARATSFQVTQHNVTNQYVTLKGDEALVRSYAIAFHKPHPGDGQQSITVGVQYYDVCRRHPEGWLIAERRAAIQWTERTTPNDT
jgi:hypothetical protein